MSLFKPRSSPNNYAKSKYFSLCLLVVLCVTLTIAEYFQLWPYWGIPRLSEAFVDFQAMAASAECDALGLDVFVSNPCDFSDRRHGYSRVWFLLDDIGISTSNYQYFGFLLSAVFVISFLSISAPSTKFEFFFTLSLLLSPAIILGIERANADLLVFSFLALSAQLISSDKKLNQIIAYFCIYLSAALKFYPLIAFSLYVMTAKNNRFFWAVTIFTIILTLLFIFITLDDYKNIDITSPDRRFTFGSRYLLQLFISASAAKWLSLLIWVAVLLSIFFLNRNHTEFDSASPQKTNILMFLAGGIVSLFTFINSNNYDYRCVFLLLCVPFIFEIRKHSKYRQQALATLLLMLAVLWWESLIQFVLTNFSDGREQAHSYLFARFGEQIVTWLLMYRIAWLVMSILRPSIYKRFGITIFKAPS